jgi:hypothetical protein
MGTAKGNGNTQARTPFIGADRLALILADMLAEVLGKEATLPLGAPGPQGVGSASKEHPAGGGKK